MGGTFTAYANLQAAASTSGSATGVLLTTASTNDWTQFLCNINVIDVSSGSTISLGPNIHVAGGRRLLASSPTGSSSTGEGSLSYTVDYANPNFAVAPTAVSPFILFATLLVSFVLLRL